MSSTEAAIATANRDGIIEDTINPWNGTLIFREAYSILGDIKFECFIWGEEEEYFERAHNSEFEWVLLFQLDIATRRQNLNDQIWSEEIRTTALSS